LALSISSFQTKWKLSISINSGPKQPTTSLFFALIQIVIYLHSLFIFSKCETPFQNRWYYRLKPTRANHFNYTLSSMQQSTETSPSEWHASCPSISRFQQDCTCSFSQFFRVRNQLNDYCDYQRRIL
jgi:hypothetical protein